MPVNLSIKNVPDLLADRLRDRAEKAHRSLQGELLAILEQAVYGSDPLTLSEALDLVRGLGLRTSPKATGMIRADRDVR